MYYYFISFEKWISNYRLIVVHNFNFITIIVFPQQVIYKARLFSITAKNAFSILE